MKPAWLVIAVLLVLCPSVRAQEDVEPRPGPSVVKLPVEGVVAQLAFEDGTRISVSSKPAPLRPGTYWLKAMSLFRKDDKGRTWELRSTGVFGSLANVTIDAGQEKILLLGKPVGLIVEAKPAEDPPGVRVLAVSVRVVGISGEEFFPGAYLDGRSMTLPNVTIKDENGKTLAAGQCVIRENRYGWFAWRYPAGFKAKYDVDVGAVMGPFEFKPSKSVEPIEKPQ